MRTSRISVATITRVLNPENGKENISLPVFKTLSSFASTVPNHRFSQYLVVCACEDRIRSHVERKLNEFGEKKLNGKLRTIFIPIEQAGFSKQRNIALEKSDGDILVFVDDDMTFSTGWFDELIRTIEKRKDAFAVSGIVLPEKTGNCIGVSQGILLHPGGGIRMLSEYKEVSEIPFFHTGLSALRREAFLNIKFDEDMIYGCEDMDISVRVKQRFPDAKFFINPRSLAFHSTRNSLHEIFLWSRRYGRGRYMVYRKHEIEMPKFFVHKALFFLSISYFFPALAPLFFLAFYLMYYIRLRKKVSRMFSSIPEELRYFPMNCSFFLPIVFFTINLGFDIGRVEEMIKSALTMKNVV